MGLIELDYNLNILICLFRIKPHPSIPPPPPPPPLPTNNLVSGVLLSPSMRNFVRTAGLSGTLAICLGVYGAHAMKDNTPEELKRVCLEIFC